MREPWMEAEDREAEWERMQERMTKCVHCGCAMSYPDRMWDICGDKYCEDCAKLLFEKFAPEV